LGFSQNLRDTSSNLPGPNGTKNLNILRNLYLLPHGGKRNRKDYKIVCNKMTYQILNGVLIWKKCVKLI
jgi:hypothetical protein